MATPLPEPPHQWATFAVSPDERLVTGSIVDDAKGHGDSQFDIWRYDTQRKMLTRMTFDGNNSNPIWTRDGRYVTFVSTRSGKRAIYQLAADASGSPKLLLEDEILANPESWTRDGALVYTKRDENSDQPRTQIWIMPAPGSGGGNKPNRFLESPFKQSNPRVSPDMKWIAYYSDESGENEVYVVPFSGVGGKLQISIHGGGSPDGREAGASCSTRNRGHTS
jgi:Tol biopolymer transport system component